MTADCYKIAVLDMLLTFYPDELPEGVCDMQFNYQGHHATLSFDPADYERYKQNKQAVATAQPFRKQLTPEDKKLLKELHIKTT